MFPPRTPWPQDSPQVVVHSELVLRDHHPAYAAAKAGDDLAALEVAEDLLSPAATMALGEIIGDRRAVLLPITALETAGFNAIPDAMAQVLCVELGLPVAFGRIVQSNWVGHTRAPAFNRIVTPATFEGEVEPGWAYVLVDDHVGLGGTLANLKGYVEINGGVVIAMTTLTESRDGRQIALRPQTRDVLRERHGEALENFWREQFGHGLDCLTDIEGQLLGREPSLDAIRDRLAKAAVEARSRGLKPAVGPWD